MTAVAEERTGLSYAEIRRTLAELMWRRDEWAGCPVPIDGLTLRVESKSPWKALETIFEKREEEARAPVDPDEELVDIVGCFYSHRRQAVVYILKSLRTGLHRAFVGPGGVAHRLWLLMNSMMATWAFDLEAEARAIAALRGHISASQFESYALLGTFIERSQRSRVAYVFRRARPTLAVRAETRDRVLCALCLHPIAYYEQSFVGAMTPTDDVLAHLLLMRADEPMFWRRANQHDPDTPEAGL